MDCGSTGYYVYGSLEWGDSRFAIGPDGTFNASADSDGTVSGRPARFHDEISRAIRRDECVGHRSELGRVRPGWDPPQLHERPETLDGSLQR